jgi:hypothetical protein
MAARVIAPWWSARGGVAWFDGDAATQERLAAGVEKWTTGSPRISTGHTVIDGEWVFATYQMGALGFAQVALQHPESRAGNIVRINRCLETLLSARVRAFDKREWNEDPLDSLDGDHGHAAYLGYLDLSLSYARLIDPQSRFAPENDRITEALVRRLEHSSSMMLETYPRQVYPPDNTAVAGAIALYDKATGADHSALLRRWADRVRHDYLDKNGLLYQHLTPEGRVDSHGRGSGTALGVYFLSFLDDPLSQQLETALVGHLDATHFGFGAVREYAPGVRGRADIDSGPLLFGLSPVATGFDLAGARIYGERARFSRLYATADLFGAPDGSRFVFGGPVGDAILFAMFTAQPRERIHR